MYEYDAWGKILSYSGIGSTDYSAITYNPLRYRGYIYDNETGFYYLQSRYYDPSIRRFINADGMMAGTGSLQGHNLFAYCFNNPVYLTDESGKWPGLGTLLVVTTLFLIGEIRNVHASICDNKANEAADADPATTTKNRILNDQKGDTGKNFRYGFFPASYNGCEAMALHNAKVLKGIDSTLSETMNTLQSARTMPLGGLIGTLPKSMGRALDKEGIPYIRVELTEMTQVGTYIVSYWTGPFTLHTVAVSYDGTAYTFYNTSKDYNWLLNHDDNYICGYYLG